MSALVFTWGARADEPRRPDPDGAAGVQEAEPGIKLPEPWIHSPSGLFRCRGASRVDIMEILGLAERVAARVEGALQHPIPRPVGYPVYIELLPPSGPSAGTVFTRHHLMDPGGIAHRLDIWGYADAQPEPLVRELVILLLDRCVVYRQDPQSRRAAARSLPPGLGAGLARVLFPALREQALRIAHDAWLIGDAGDPAIRLSAPESGDPTEESITGVIILWLRDRHPAALDELVTRVARDGLPAAPELANLLGFPDPGALRRDWHLWMAAQDSKLKPWTLTPAQRAAQLRDSMCVDGAQWPDLAPGDAPEFIAPETLLARRGEPWVPRTALHMIRQIRSVPTGHLPRLDRAARLAERALWELQYPQPPIPLRWLLFQTSDRSIARRLEQVHQELNRIEEGEVTASP